jgi:16S rRNA (cytidine1402-2'-O)-methyltransferase
VEVLRASPCVVAEDTRRTRALLSHLEIHGKTVRALNAHSSPQAVADIVSRLLVGEDVAFVTDAGTPAVSDPGRALVAASAAQGIEARVIPGASAVTAAVALSALVDGPFLFLGFLPRKGSDRELLIQRILRSPEPVIFFESPPRMADTLAELAQHFPTRAAFVGRELTKLHEEGLRGTVQELSDQQNPWRGEIVIVIAAGEPRDEPDAERRALIDSSLRAAISCGASPSRIARALAEVSGLPRRELYERAIELRESVGPSEDE